MSEGGQQQGGGDNSLAPLWITIALFVALFVIWHFGHEYIVRFVFFVRYYEAKFVSMFSNALGPVMQWIEQTDTATVDFSLLATLSQKVGTYLNVFFVPILIGLAGIVFVGAPAVNFRRTYSMKILAELEQVNWPQIRPALQGDLVKQDVGSGPWSMALSPMEFAKRNNLLRKKKAFARDREISFKPHIEAVLRREEAHRLMVLQLGPYWQGPEKLPIYARALFGAFAARGNHDVETAHALLQRISASVARGKN